MDPADAVALLADAIRGHKGAWADLGAGTGTFTRALADLLGPNAQIYAVDRDSRAVEALKRWSESEAPNVTVVSADFTQPFELPGPRGMLLDGVLLANALHFVRDAAETLARVAAMVRPGGKVVLVEYDRRAANRWVPYPLPVARLPKLAAAAGLTSFAVTATRPSEYQGILYAAVADRITPTMK